MTIKTRLVDVKITEPDGTVVFEKPGFEVPEHFSDRAATVIASKYAAKGENSAIQIIDRVVNQITIWGEQQGYFDIKRDEKTLRNMKEVNSFKDNLKDILINQRAAFNSPCFPAGHLVLMEDGTQKPIEEVSVGDFVVTHKNRPRKILQKHIRKTEENLVHLDVVGLPKNSFACTTDHPVLAIRKPDVICPKRKDRVCGAYLKENGTCSYCGKPSEEVLLTPEWAEAITLTTGDYVVETIDMTTSKDIDTIKVSEEAIKIKYYKYR
jgi:hypothetical protein